MTNLFNKQLNRITGRFVVGTVVPFPRKLFARNLRLDRVIRLVDD